MKIKKVFVPNIVSSNVFRVAHFYDTLLGEGKEGSLVVSMKGGTYVYMGVPLEVMVDLIKAESAGKFLNSVIKPHYPFREATAEEHDAMDTGEPCIFDDAAYRELFPEVHAALSAGGHAVDLGVGAPAPKRELTAEELQAMIMPPNVNWPQVIDIKLLDPRVSIKYAKPGDAAFDLMAAIQEPKTIYPGEHALIGTGIAMKLSLGLAGLALPRSGLARNLRISLVNAPGLIDSGYTGEIGVLVENRGDDPFVVNPLDRIAQYMIVPAITPIFRIVDELEQTERGSSGFGSTGVSQS